MVEPPQPVSNKLPSVAANTKVKGEMRMVTIPFLGSTARPFDFKTGPPAGRKARPGRPDSVPSLLERRVRQCRPRTFQPETRRAEQIDDANGAAAR